MAAKECEETKSSELRDQQTYEYYLKLSLSKEIRDLPCVERKNSCRGN